MLKSLDTARPLRVMSEKSVFAYLEQETAEIQSAIGLRALTQQKDRNHLNDHKHLNSVIRCWC